MITFLGTGLLGAGMVRAALARGESVTVWNRTSAKAGALAPLGARVAATPAEAVKGAEQVHLVLLDDAAVDDVLAQCTAALEPGAIVIDHSTTSPILTAARAQRLSAQGIAFLHSPVFMGPANAQTASGVMYASGPRTVFERALPTLERMAGKVRYFGERPDLAAAYKLFGNLTFMFVISGLADMYALARGLQVDLPQAYTVFEDFSPMSAVNVRGKRMAEQQFTPPAFELTAALKDIRLMLETADTTGATLRILPVIAERFREVIAAGHGADDVSSIAANDVA